MVVSNERQITELWLDLSECLKSNKDFLQDIGHEMKHQKGETYGDKTLCIMGTDW